ENEKRARREQINQQLAYAGMTEEQYLAAEGQTVEDFEGDLERRVRDALAARFLLDQVAKTEQIGVDENELTQQIVRRAQQMGMPPDQFAQQAMQQGQVPELVGEVRRAKALALIVESASVKDRSGNPVELKRLLPDGTYASEEDAAGADAGSEPASRPEDAATSIVTDPAFVTPAEDAGEDEGQG